MKNGGFSWFSHEKWCPGFVELLFEILSLSMSWVGKQLGNTLYFYASFSSKEVGMVVFSTGNVVLALEIW